MSDITCSMHGVHPGSFTFSLVDAYIYHEYLKKIFAVDAACVQRAVTLSRQWTQTASKAAERVKYRCLEFFAFDFGSLLYLLSWLFWSGVTFPLVALGKNQGFCDPLRSILSQKYSTN